jgi:hypothetical protein
MWGRAEACAGLGFVITPSPQPQPIGHAEEHEDDRARCIGFFVSAREAVLRVHCRALEKLIQTYEPVHRRDIEWRATIPVEKRSNVKVAKRDFWFSGKR